MHALIKCPKCGSDHTSGKKKFNVLTSLYNGLRIAASGITGSTKPEKITYTCSSCGFKFDAID